jgi:recombination protein RecR
MKYPASIQNLINQFSKLPTVGPKTSERFVLFMLQQSQKNLDLFAEAISGLKKNIKICQLCLSVSDSDPCKICSDKKRDDKKICLVATTRDMLSIEATGEYDGVYFVLGGIINPIENKGPEKLNFSQLIKKIKEQNIKEVIIALNPDIEGETTAMYIKKLLETTPIILTRLARGLPMGSDLEYADQQTIANALKFRQNLK